MAGKKRQYKTIFKWLQKELKPGDPSMVKYSDKVSTHIGGGSASFQAFIGSLRSSENFAKDGVTIVHTEVHTDRRVRNVQAALVANYTARKWDVK